MKRIFAIGLALLLALGLLPASAFAASTSSASIGGAQANIVTIPAGEGRGAMLTIGQGSVNKDMPAADHVALANAGQGTLAVSVNGAVFNSYYNGNAALGYPDNCAQCYGMLMRGGEVICRGSGKNVLLGVTDTGKFLIDRVSVATSAVFRGRDKFTFWGVNVYHADPAAINMFTQEMGYGFALQSGAVAVRIRDGVVSQVQTGLSRLECPASGEKVVVFNSAAWANACNWNTQPREGNTAAVETALTPEKAGTQEDWNRVTTAVGCGPWLLEGGMDRFAENTSNDEKMSRDYRAQRTFAAILSDGSLMLGECSCTFGEIISYLQSIGAVDAMALDGGASSTLYLGGGGYLQPAGRKLNSMLHIIDYGQGMPVLEKPAEQMQMNGEPSPWAASFVERALDAGLVPEGFALTPKANITRAEFASLAVSLIKLHVGKGSDYEKLLKRNGISYDDARASFDDTYLLDVMQAYQMGIVTGKGERRFDPNGSITRREAAVMLTNTAKILGRSADGAGIEYEDAADIAWAADFVDFVTRADIMGSASATRTLFNPLGYYTQEQAIVTMCNLLP